MQVKLIVAIDEDRGIGRNNDLMWNLPDDMSFFKQTTAGHVVVMGRKNYDSIPERFRPLPNRENVVLTRNQSFTALGCRVFHSLKECLEVYQNESMRTVFIIGGGEIYRQALELKCVDEMFITHVHKSYGADTFFPSFEASEWIENVLQEHPIDERHEAGFTIVHYCKKLNA